ncbi:MAG: hypothetical protein H7831_00770 [Magnetococcus sp. WYHC-3]
MIPSSTPPLEQTAPTESGGIAQQLQQVFREECQRRAARAAEQLAQSSGVPPPEALDQIHQEFDSLHGAARAVDLRCVESYARLLARLARALRNHACRATAADWDLLARGVALTPQLCHCTLGLDPPRHQQDMQRLAAEMDQAWERLRGDIPLPEGER